MSEQDMDAIERVAWDIAIDEAGPRWRFLHGRPPSAEEAHADPFIRSAAAAIARRMRAEIAMVRREVIDA
jgi:hypothetical protein